MTAESEGLGFGATFTVRLPIRAVHVADAEFDAEARPLSEGGRPRIASLAGSKILVVEDDEDSRDLLASALQRVGASVTAVASAKAGFAHLENHGVDLLISDIGMPEEDGFMLMRRVRALPASRGGNVPAIALTAYTRGEDVKRSLEVGYQRHMAKPAGGRRARAHGRVDARGKRMT